MRHLCCEVRCGNRGRNSLLQRDGSFRTTNILINDSLPTPEETVAAFVKKVGPMEKLLIIGDEQTVQLLNSGLHRDYTILEAKDTVLAMEQLLMHGPKVVILDLMLISSRAGSEEALPPPEGLHWLKSMIECRPGTKVVVLTEKEERETDYSAGVRSL